MMYLKHLENEYENQFSAEVFECIEAVRDNFHLVKTKQNNEFKMYCEKLFACATHEKSDYLFALSYHYLMMYYAYDNDYKDTVSCALEGIKYQTSSEQYDLLARSYNVLGILTESAGDIAKAIDYLLTCIDLCNTYHLSYVHCMASSNLAAIFRHSGIYDKALTYYEEAESFFKKSSMEETPTNNCSLLDVLCNKGYCLLSVDNLGEAQKCAGEIISLAGKMDSCDIYYDVFVINTFLATVANRLNDTAMMLHYRSIAQCDFHTADNYIYFLDELDAYMELYLCMEDYDSVIEIADYFLKKCEKDQASFKIYSMFMQKKIFCVDAKNNTEEYLKCSRAFFERYKEETCAHSESIRHAENAHKESVLFQKQKYEMMLLNEKLLAESRHDILTGLPNRAYLNSFAEETLSKSLNNNVTFGIELLDVDFFKNINDSYGHLEGDRYLSSISEIMRKLSEQYGDMFVARYGGDEFVIVYYNKTDTEIIQIMTDLKEHVNRIILPDSSPLGINSLSVSQGAINRIPQSFNRLWDFLAHADKTLYEVKNRNKDSFLLKTEF